MSLSVSVLTFSWFLAPSFFVWFFLVSPFTRYLAFLAADWSGLSVPLRFSFPLVAPWSLRSTSLSLPFLSSSALLSPCFLCVLASRVPFLFPASLSLLFFLCLLFLSSLLLTPLAADWSGLSGLSLLLSPFPLLFCFLLHPRVLCLVFLAADWSGFPAPPSSPSFLLSFTSLIPDLLSRRDLRLSVIFLAADWSGVSHCWLPSQTIPSSKPGTFSGRRLVRGVAAHHILMVLLTRQQAEQSWSEPDPNAQFDDLLEALGLYKDISTEYGLNQTVHHQWRFGIP